MSELLVIILFWGAVFGIYEGVSFLRGLALHRVYGKTADALTELARDQDWENAADSVLHKDRYGNTGTAPESVEPYTLSC